MRKFFLITVGVMAIGFLGLRAVVIEGNARLDRRIAEHIAADRIPGPPLTRTPEEASVEACIEAIDPMFAVRDDREFYHFDLMPSSPPNEEFWQQHPHLPQKVKVIAPQQFWDLSVPGKQHAAISARILLPNSPPPPKNPIPDGLQFFIQYKPWDKWNISNAEEGVMVMTSIPAKEPAHIMSELSSYLKDIIKHEQHHQYVPGFSKIHLDGVDNREDLFVNTDYEKDIRAFASCDKTEDSANPHCTLEYENSYHIEIRARFPSERAEKMQEYERFGRSFASCVIKYP